MHGKVRRCGVLRRLRIPIPFPGQRASQPKIWGRTHALVSREDEDEVARNSYTLSRVDSHTVTVRTLATSCCATHLRLFIKVLVMPTMPATL